MKQSGLPALIVALIAVSLCILPSVYADQATAQEQSLAFIENALPVDLSKYNLTFVKYSSIDGAVGDLRYALSSESGTVDVLCRVEKNTLVNCHIYPMNAPAVSDRQYASLLDAVKSFLERYQNYSKLDSAKFIAMLDGVDLTKNSTTTVGDTKLTITSVHFAGEDRVNFNWAYTANGVDYSLLRVGFQDGSFDAFSDNRAVYTIVDTSVNISKEQAIEIALGNLSSYSYEMPDHSFVKDFNITKDKIWAELAVSRSNYEMRPYWDIRMPLNQTYPGSVHGITVFIWANTGEIISYSNIAYGGIEYSDKTSPETTPTPEASSPTSTSSPTPTANTSPTPPLSAPTQQPTAEPTRIVQPTSYMYDSNASSLTITIGAIAVSVAVAVTAIVLVGAVKKRCK